MMDHALPDQVTHEQVADIFMSSMSGQYTTREEFIKRLHAKYPDVAALNAFWCAKKAEAQAMLDAAMAAMPRAGAGYTLIDGGKAIRCGACGCTSSNAGDIANLYCSMCKKFHAH